MSKHLDKVGAVEEQNGSNKRKQEPQPDNSGTDTKSRRGRPRKKINYYELANPGSLDRAVSGFSDLADDFELQAPPSERGQDVGFSNRKYDNKNGTSAKEKLKRQKVGDLTRHNDTLIESSLETKPNIATHTRPLSLNEKQLENVVNSDFGTSSVRASSEISQPALSQIEPLTSTSTTAKDRRYNFTGATVKMMSTLFTLFSAKEENGSEDTNHALEEDRNNQNQKTNRARRPLDGNSKIKQQAIKEEADSEEEGGDEEVTCAVCQQTFSKTLWSHHKQRYHNNLAWRIGEPPLDLSNQNFVMHTLNALYKKKKPLYCDKCGEVKKSVVGFLSHQTTCSKSEQQLESVKVTCTICGKKMLPVSMTTHMKFVHPKCTKTTETSSSAAAENGQDNVEQVLPSKRGAAKKALKIIENCTKNTSKPLGDEEHFTKNLELSGKDFVTDYVRNWLSVNKVMECKFGCLFMCTSLDNFEIHHSECHLKPESGFICKKCLWVSEKLENIIYHVESVHDVIVECGQELNSTLNKSSNNAGIPSFLSGHDRRRTKKTLFQNAFEWMYDFCKQNFSEPKLFEDLRSDWQILPFASCKSYLPRLNRSCDVAQFVINNFTSPSSLNPPLYKKYELFESLVEEGGNIQTLFCGGPISSMAWLPTDFERSDRPQILAVSVLNSPEDRFYTARNYAEKTAVQFWNFGLLANKEWDGSKARLIFNLAHEHGPIWHMEWCPSGCWDLVGDEQDVEGDRMGLLAVAGSDSVVYVYSVPFLSNQEGLYYQARPAVKLMLERADSGRLGNLGYFPSRISWTKASGHHFISVGYTNGMVAVFNINTTSFILKQTDSDGINVFFPIKSFQPHFQQITALSLYHLKGGGRFLLTGSLDRSISMWDLESLYPLCSLKRNFVTDGFWPSNWLSYVISGDEASTSVFAATIWTHFRDYLRDDSSSINFLLSPSTISAMSGSDWLNGIVQGNVLGEIIAMFPHQMMHIPDHQKFVKKKRMLFGYTHLLDKTKTPHERKQFYENRKRCSIKRKLSGVRIANYDKCNSSPHDIQLFCDEPVVYSEAENKYALVFCDNKMENQDVDFPDAVQKELAALSKSMGTSEPNLYGLSAINKIAFNPNRQSSLYYATGYQAGFVRVTWMQFLRDDEQIK